MSVALKTVPRACAPHALLLSDILIRLQAAVSSIEDSLTMSPEDCGDALGGLQDALSEQHGRLSAAREAAYREAAREKAAS